MFKKLLKRFIKELVIIFILFLIVIFVLRIDNLSWGQAIALIFIAALVEPIIRNNMRYFYLILTRGMGSFILILLSVIFIFLFFNKFLDGSLRIIIFALFGYVVGAVIQPSHEFLLRLKERKSSPTIDYEIEALETMAPILIRFRKRTADIVFDITLLAGIITFFLIILF